MKKEKQIDGDDPITSPADALQHLAVPVVVVIVNVVELVLTLHRTHQH
jgi:hypothetical protein